MSDISLPGSKTPDLLTKLGGKFGLVPPLAIGALVFWFWGKIVPFVVTALTDTLHAVLLGAILVAIGAVLFDERIRTLFFYIYSSVIRLAVTGQAHADPIGNMKTYVERRQKQLAEFDDAIGSLRGNLQNLKNNVTSNTEKLNKANAMAAALKPAADKGDMEASAMFTVQSNEAARRTKRIDDEKVSIQRFDNTVVTLSRVRTACKAEILDKQYEVANAVEKQKEGNALTKASRSIRSILHGDITSNQLFAQSQEYVQDNYNKAIGDFDQLLDITKDILANADFDNAAAVATMNARIDSWTKQNSDVQMGKGSKAEVLGVGNVIQLPPPKTTVPVAANQDTEATDYDKYFKS